MAAGNPSTWTAKTAAEVCGKFALGDGTAKMLIGNMAPGQFLDALLNSKEYSDAIRFLAFALPKREAVWWACQCARATLGATPPPPVTAVLQATEKWVADPTDDHRRAAMATAEAAGFDTPAAIAGAAAFWSGGSMGPPNVPAIPPQEDLTAKGVAGAVMLAAVQTQPEKAPEKYRQFIALGIAVSTGTQRWKDVRK